MLPRKKSNAHVRAFSINELRIDFLFDSLSDVISSVTTLGSGDQERVLCLSTERSEASESYSKESIIA